MCINGEVLPVCLHYDEDESKMGDVRISEHPLYIVLAKGEQVARQHPDDSDNAH